MQTTKSALPPRTSAPPPSSTSPGIQLRGKPFAEQSAMLKPRESAAVAKPVQMRRGTLDNGAGGTSNHEATLATVDVAATVAAVKSELDARITRAEQEIEALGNPPSDVARSQDLQVKRAQCMNLRDRLRACTDERGLPELQRIAGEAGITYAPVFNRTSSSGQTGQTVDVNANGVTVTDSNEEATDASNGGKKANTRVTSSTATTVSATGASQVRKEGASKLNEDGSGTSRSATTTTSASLGKEGPTFTRGQSNSGTTTSAGGASKTGENASSTTVGYDIKKKQGSVGRTNERVDTTTTAKGASTENRQSNTNTYTVGAEGAGATNRSANSTVKKDNDGNTTSTSSTTVTTSGGVNWSGPNGPGVNASVGAENSEADRNGAVSKSGSVGGGVNANGANAAAAAKSSVSRGPVSVTGNVGFGVSFTCDIKPVPDSAPPAFDAITTIKVDASVGGSIGNSNAVKAAPAKAGESNGFRDPAKTSMTGSVGASVAASKSLVFTERLSEREAERYQDVLDAAKKGGGIQDQSHAALAQMARTLQMQKNHARAASSAMMDDPQLARSLQDGQSVEMTETVTTTANASGQGSVGVVSAGVSGSTGNTVTVTRRLSESTVGDKHYTVITLTFRDQSDTTTSGNASLDGAGVAGSNTSSQGRGETVTLRVDRASPDHDALVHRAAATSDRAAAHTLARELGGAYSTTSDDTNSSTFGAGTTNAGNVENGIVVGDSSGTSATTNVGETDATGGATLSATTTGTSSSTVNVRIGGVDRLGAGTSANATNTVDGNEANGNQQQVDLSRTSSSTVALPDFLTSALRTNTSRLEGFHLDDGDVDTLAACARNASAWTNAPSGALLNSYRGAWEQLRRSLLAPSPDPDQARVDREVAIRIARGKAVTDFVAHVRPSLGLPAIEAVMHGDGQTGGVHTEWPDTIVAQKDAYDTLRRRIRQARNKYGGINGADRMTAISADVADITKGLSAVLAEVQACTDFSDDGVKMQMVGHLRDLINQIEDVREEERNRMIFTEDEPATTEAEAAPATPAPTRGGRRGRNVRPVAPQPQQERQPDPTPPPVLEDPNRRARLEVEMNDHIHTMQDCRNAQSRAFGTASSLYSGLPAEPDALGQSESHRAMDALRGISHLMPTWRSAIERYRARATELGVPSGEIDRLIIRPNINWRIKLLEDVLARASNDIRIGNNFGALRDQWRAESP